MCTKILSALFGMNSNKSYNIERRGTDIILNPKEGHSHTLIWMHGLGDTADGYLDFFTCNHIYY